MSVTFSALSVLAFILSIGGAFLSVRSAIRVRELQDRLIRLPLSRLESLETSLADVTETLTQIANRVKMMRVRSAVNHVQDGRSDGAPDPYKDPQKWRDWMNQKLSRAKIGA